MVSLGAIQILCLLMLAPLLCRSAFINASDPNRCWGSNCVEQKSPGHNCYYPAANQTNATSCSGGHAGDSDYQAVVLTHLAQSLSIGYYMPVTNAWLGGVNYSLASLAPNTSVTICLSGQVGLDNSYQTLCEATSTDDNIDDSGAYCIVALGQHYVSDGCYIAMPNNTTPTNTTSKELPYFGLPEKSESACLTGTPTGSQGGLSTSDKITLGTSISFGLPGVLVIIGGIWKKQRIRGNCWSMTYVTVTLLTSLICSLLDRAQADRCAYSWHI